MKTSTTGIFLTGMEGMGVRQSNAQGPMANVQHPTWKRADMAQKDVIASDQRERGTRDTVSAFAKAMAGQAARTPSPLRLMAATQRFPLRALREAPHIHIEFM